MNVLSLFDGISCGQLALNRAGIHVENYFASEINKNAISVAKDNFKFMKHVGCITKIESSNFKKIDLLIGGSPCQSFSSAGKQLNFNDPRGKLFFDYVRLLKEIKPKYFLLENVVMKQEYQDVISNLLSEVYGQDIKPILINSQLVSAQNRNRLYWTNIKNIQQPDDKKINLIDIIENLNFVNKATIIGRRLNSKGVRKDYDKNIPAIQCIEVRNTNKNKSNCLTTVEKDNVLTSLPIGRHVDAYGLYKNYFRYYTRKEYEILQTLPEGYTNIASPSCAKKLIGNAWTVDVISHIFKSI